MAMVRNIGSPSMDGIESKILVSVDFGTTFSGVGWAQTARPETRSLITQWSDIPGSLDGETSEKVPTKINYDDNGKVKHWGFQVGDTEPHYKEFKLGLSTRKVNDSHVEKRYPDPVGLRPNARYPAERLSIDYLRELRNHSLEIIKLKLGSAVVDNTTIEYTLTVPAIWSESDRSKTRACAKQAGFVGCINLIGEPEAAMTYVLDTMDPNIFKIGDVFIMVDAGGGTVDLVSYIIKCLKPLETTEDVVGDGNKVGGAILNRIFGAYIRDNLADLDGWDEDTLDEALDRFETRVKRKFDGSDESFLIPVPGLLNSKAKGVARGKLTISGAALRDVFEPCISAITALVLAQKQQTTGRVDSVLLVGGFGQNPYLRATLDELLPGVKVIQPPKGWQAVVEGALVTALNEDAPDLARLKISARKARKCYGVTAGIPFVHGKHQKRRQYFDCFDGIHRVTVVNWLVKKGEELSEDEPIKLPYTETWPINISSPRFAITLLAFETETGLRPPLYGDQGTVELGTLDVDLSQIPTRNLRPQRGNDGLYRYRIDVEIKAKFASAHIDYSLWYKGRCYGSVEAQYD